MPEEEHPLLPEKRPVGANHEKRKLAWKWVGTVSFATGACFSIDRGCEVSGAPPNILHACGYWFLAFILFTVTFWMWASRLRAWHKVLLILLGFVVLALALMPMVVKQYRIERTPPILATVSPPRVHLHSGTYSIETEVTISNQTNTPIYMVFLRVSPDFGVSSKSMNIVPVPLKASETTFNDRAFVDVGIVYEMPPPTNKNAFLVIYRIPALGHRTFRISGTQQTNSWADLSIIEYQTQFELEKHATNDIRWPMLSSTSAIFRGLSPTNLGYLTNFHFEVGPELK
jgi:hypothetical protein